jgi:Icc-related predicted phosphoesterase
LKICCISDTHSKIIPDDQIPECEVIVHTGDITNNGKIYWLQKQAEWFRHLIDTKCSHFVCISGNHDFCLDAFRKENCEYAIPNIFGSTRIHYLRDERLWLNFPGRTVKFYGTPWTISGSWAFSEMDRMKRREIFNKIPMDTDVLLSHGPPYSILDRCDDDGQVKSIGDLELLAAVDRVRPKLHVFGHIHDGYGETNLWGVNGTTFVNAAVTRVKPTAADPYPLGNPPIVVEI